MRTRWNLTGGILLAAILIAPVRTSFLAIEENVRGALQLAHEARDRRRTVVWGDWYGITLELTGTPLTTTIDVVMVTAESRDVAIFAGSSLSPRPCYYFNGWESWRSREQAALFHDADAANAVAPAPEKSAIVLVADSKSKTPIRIATAAELSR